MVKEVRLSPNVFQIYKNIMYPCMRFRHVQHTETFPKIELLHYMCEKYFGISAKKLDSAIDKVMSHILGSSRIEDEDMKKALALAGIELIPDELVEDDSEEILDWFYDEIYKKDMGVVNQIALADIVIGLSYSIPGERFTILISSMWFKKKLKLRGSVINENNKFSKVYKEWCFDALEQMDKKKPFDEDLGPYLK